MVIGLIKLIKNDLIHIKDLDKFKNYIKERFINFKDKAYLMYVLILRKFEFNMEIIEKNRNLLLSIISEKINNINKSKIERKLEKLKLNKDEICNANWQICVFDIENAYKVKEFFVYRINEIPLICENHFEEKIIKFNKILKSNFSENSSTLSNCKKVSHNLETKSNNSSITIENKSTDFNSSTISQRNNNNFNNSYSNSNSNNINNFCKLNVNLNNIFNNYRDMNENIIFDSNKKYITREYFLDNYAYNNFLIERRDHICEYKNKFKASNYPRCSISVYTNNDDTKSENQNFSSNEENSFTNEDVKDSSNTFNLKTTLDENSKNKRLEYRKKSKSFSKNFANLKKPF